MTMEQDKYTDFTLGDLKAQRFKPMRALLKDGTSKLTDYYINPSGLIGKFTSRGFKLFGRRPDKDGCCRRFYNVSGTQVLLFRHRLVAHNFGAEQTQGNCCGHIDLDSSNDKSSNLYWHTEEETPRGKRGKSKYPDKPIAMFEQVGPKRWRLVQRYSSRIFIPNNINGQKIDKRCIYKNCMGRCKTFRGYAFVYCSNIEKWKTDNGYEVV